MDHGGHQSAGGDRGHPDFDQLVLGTGTYLLAQTLVLSNEIELIGSDSASTILDGRATNRCILLTRPGAAVRNLTLQNGNAGADGDGGGILMTVSGIVENCVIYSNRACHGSGLDATNGGWIVGCLIVSNRTTSNGGWGAGLRVGGGTLAERCWIRNNHGSYGGGAACLPGGTVRNSVLAGNNAAFGGGAYLLPEGLSAESCTIAANTASFNGGVYAEYGYSPLGRVWASWKIPSSTTTPTSSPPRARTSAGTWIM